MTDLLILDNVSQRTPDGRVLVENASLRLGAGKSLALMGKSGSGKSTLLSSIALMDRFSTGDYFLDGTDVGTLDTAARDKLRSRSIGFVFQKFVLLRHVSVLENVITPLRYNSRTSKSERKALALEALASVGMESHARKRVNQLSGGEQQRVAIARAIVGSPGLILADEPTGSLDQDTGAEVMRILTHLVHTKNAALILVTHDRDLASFMDEIYEIRDGTLSRTPTSSIGLLPGSAP